ncbi:hypothetical protein [Psychromonas algicola]|uniref:hypothetical protein n=1 Tax=Psychromonas algicola TaxID=2555642 RepID=UPI0010673BB6|nr:hypothetical protein [Psychromonas sp. RZ5]TEW51896.1 hypothetical protein E2R67_05265 [Psychromonas sp. RZ5]
MVFKILYRCFPLFLFILIAHYYFQFIYQTDLLAVISWWFKYASYTDYEVPLIMSLAFAVLVFYGQIYSMSRNVSALFPGKKYKLIYTGNISTSESLFKESNANNAATATIKGLNFSPYSFSEIYKQTAFIKDKVTGELVIPHSRFSVGQLFISSLFFTAFIPLYFFIFHLLAHLIGTKPDIDYVDFRSLWHEGLQAIIEQFLPMIEEGVRLNSIGLALVSLCFFVGMIILIVVIQKLLPNRWLSDNYQPKLTKHSFIRLPSNMQNNYQIMGCPIVIYDHPRVKEYFNIIFKFDYGLSIPIYVTCAYQKVDKKINKDIILENIKHKKSMSLRMTEKLTLELLE